MNETHDEKCVSCIISNVFVCVQECNSLLQDQNSYLCHPSISVSFIIFPPWSFSLSLLIFPPSLPLSLTHSHSWSQEASAYLFCLGLLWKLPGWPGFGVWLFVHILISLSTSHSHVEKDTPQTIRVSTFPMNVFYPKIKRKKIFFLRKKEKIPLVNASTTNN